MPLLWWPLKRELPLFTRCFWFLAKGFTSEIWFSLYDLILKLMFFAIGGNPWLAFNKLKLDCWLKPKFGPGLITNKDWWFLIFSVYFYCLFLTNESPLFLFDLSRETLILTSFRVSFYSLYFTEKSYCIFWKIFESV